MSSDDIICQYLNKPGELAAACAAPHWKSTRLGHLSVSRASGAYRTRMGADSGIGEAAFADLLSGRLG